MIVGSDGDVRLWDTERNESAGFVWNGTGAGFPTSPWYDSAADSVWVVTSGNLIEIPLSVERWVRRACELVGRDLTQDEWDRFVPGRGRVVSACA